MKQIKTIKALAKELCSREKGKKQVDIAQMTEILNRLSDIMFEDSCEGRNPERAADFFLNSVYMPSPHGALIKNGAKRFLKRSKGKK